MVKTGSFYCQDSAKSYRQKRKQLKHKKKRIFSKESKEVKLSSKCALNEDWNIKINFNKILKNFFRAGEKNPKREFFNAFIIRCVRRFLHCLVSGNCPKKTSIRIDHGDVAQSRVWEEGLKLYSHNKERAILISQMAKGPSTSLIYNSIDENCPRVKSFNNQFCKDFFKDQIAIKTFELLTTLFFIDNKPDKLSERFRFKCCTDYNHDTACEEKWFCLHNYMKESYLVDIGVDSVYEGELSQDTCL